MHWYLVALRKYADFSGRSRRMEYWMFLLVNFLVSFALAAIDFYGRPGNMLGLIYGLAIIIPSFAVAVRRLHDTGRSGWWIFIALIPILGWLVLLYFMVIDGDGGDNAYGPNPKAAAA